MRVRITPVVSNNDYKYLSRCVLSLFYPGKSNQVAGLKTKIECCAILYDTAKAMAKGRQLPDFSKRLEALPVFKGSTMLSVAYPVMCGHEASPQDRRIEELELARENLGTTAETIADISR